MKINIADFSYMVAVIIVSGSFILGVGGFITIRTHLVVTVLALILQVLLQLGLRHETKGKGKL